jgi:nucleotide-binding universal stress UspA family protein
VAAAVRKYALPIRQRTALGPSPAATILQIAAHEHVDLIAMETRGRLEVADVVLGSVATGVLEHACTPVLLVRPAVPQPHL